MMTLFVFLLGLVFGSFAACMHDRAKAKWDVRAVLIEPSKCFSCGVNLKPWNNIPIVSYLVQRGRCSSCGAKIPAHLPLIELAVALGAVVVYHLILWVFNVA